MVFDIAFSGNPLDRAESRRNDEAWLARQAKAPTARFLAFVNLKPVMETAPGLAPAWFSPERVDAALASGAAPVFLGLDGAAARFAVALEADHAAGLLDGGRKAIDVRTVAMAGMGGHLGILAQARALLAWHARHGFCAVCGKPSGPIKGGAARRCRDAVCGAEHFPRTDPVAIMLVTTGDSCLLGRNGHFPPGFFSALAGFIEPGETIEEAVAREVAEEAGVKVGAVRYVASQPWPFPSSLMIGCTAVAMSEAIAIDPHEIAEARWFSRAEVKAALGGDRDAPFTPPPPLAIAHHLLRYWLNGG